MKCPKCGECVLQDCVDVGFGGEHCGPVCCSDEQCG